MTNQAGDVKDYKPTKTVDVIEYWHSRALKAEQEAGRLREAVNDYLAAQNFAGYKDGDYGHDGGCRDVRRRLCETVHELNDALSHRQPEEDPGG